MGGGRAFATTFFTHLKMVGKKESKISPLPLLPPMCKLFVERVMDVSRSVYNARRHTRVRLHTSHQSHVSPLSFDLPPGSFRSRTTTTSGAWS